MTPMTIFSGRFRRALGLAAVILTAIVLAGCDSGSSKGSTTKGKRIAILEQNRKIEADGDLKNVKPVLPPIDVIRIWPQAGYNASHATPNAAIELRPKEIWTSSIGEGSDSDYKLLAMPVAANGMLFTMDSRGLVRAFDAATGDRKWEFDTTPENADQDELGGGISFGDDMLYASSGFGEVIALDPANGTMKWRRMVGNPVRGAPTVYGERVYVVSIDNELKALDAKTGEILWHHRGIAESATLMGASNPAAAGDSVLAAYSSGEIFNLRPENGRVSWSYMLTVPSQVGAMPAIADIRGLPVVDQGRVFAISHSGRAASIDQRTGERVWEADIGGVNTPLVSGDTVYVLSNDMQLVALTRDSGRVIWVSELQKREDPEDNDSDPVLWTGPIMAANRLWLVNSLGQLVNFDPSDGRQLDTIELSGPASIPPIVVNNTMYVVLDKGSITALR
ncbi:MAG: PQQ-binding-like beta-propeller repeat protein [Bdellovibrionales bacterium]